MFCDCQAPSQSPIFLLLKQVKNKKCRAVFLGFGLLIVFSFVSYKMSLPYLKQCQLECLLKSDLAQNPANQ